MSPSTRALLQALPRHLLPSILIALACIALGIALLSFARTAHEQASQTQQQVFRQATELRQRHAQTLREEARIRTSILRYARMRHDGLIGPERRLDWDEALRAAGNRLRIPRLAYELLPQRPHASMAGTAGATGPLLASRMKLDLDLLHEGDLLRVLDFLQARRDALVVIDRCSLQRHASDESAITASLHTLSAQCELDWITLATPAPESAASDAALLTR